MGLVFLKHVGSAKRFEKEKKNVVKSEPQRVWSNLHLLLPSSSLEREQGRILLGR